MALDQVQQDRQVIERVLSSAPDSGLRAEELENVPSVQHSTTMAAALRELTDKQANLRTLRYRYTDEQPSVRKLITDIDELQKRTIPSLAQGLVAELQVRENDLRRQIATGSSTLAGIPSLAIDDAMLQRDVTTAEQTLQGIQQSYDQVRLAEMSALPDLKILDPAVVPMRPVGTLAPVLIVLAFLGSLGAGVVGAVLLDRTDTRFRYPEQVTADMGLTILGVVPRVSRENGNGRNAPQVIEALRSIRLGVQNAYGAGPMVLTITSPGSSDGKSFITSNLGLAFADAGLRTIVIDGDIRRGLLHRVLNAKRKPGLIDHLGGNAGREDIIQKTDFPQLSFIGCGQRTPNGPELLSSPAMGQLLTSLRSRFDVILVDSAPDGGRRGSLRAGNADGQSAARDAHRRHRPRAGAGEDRPARPVAGAGVGCGVERRRSGRRVPLLRLLSGRVRGRRRRRREEAGPPRLTAGPKLEVNSANGSGGTLGECAAS